MEVIRVENLSKLYDLGQVGTGTVSKDLNRWWARMRGKGDPYARIGQVNDRTKKAGKDDSVWALRDINFSVRQGEVVGIIGRNGSGKSTLLKILSRITTPTAGTTKLKGRIASLLEVGTGFHPEMTGRENIFMNGTLLGMSRSEIQSNFDEIVDFAGVAMYIDTPVKRYSSGMQVRLGFAVAAFLEPEILIVDEVLAVGDAEFQKKAIGRLKHVSKGDGRTVLFVSHQMDAITRLCDRALVLESGRLTCDDEAARAIRFYLGNKEEAVSSVVWQKNEARNEMVMINKVSVRNHLGVESAVMDIRKDFFVCIDFEILTPNVKVTPGINIHNERGDYLFTSHDVQNSSSGKQFATGSYESCVTIPGNFLSEGLITLSVAFMSYDPFTVHLHEKEILSISIVDSLEGTSARGIYSGEFPGLVRPLLVWKTKKKNNSRICY